MHDRCRRHAALVVLAAVLCACQSERTRDNTGTADSPATACGGTALSDSGVGDLRIGLTVADIAARCRIIRDSTMLRTEGQPARMIAVQVKGDTIDAEVVNDSIWRIEVTTPRAVTRDSLGVGTPISRLLTLSGLRVLQGEGNVFVMSDAHCGLSFEIGVSGPAAASTRWDLAQLRRLPPDTPVSRVLVIGCRGRPS